MGNQLWKIVGKGKVGRPKLFLSPEQLWEAATEYFEWCDDNPWTRIETIIKGSGLHPGTDEKKVPTKRLYSMMGICLYLGVSESYFRTFKSYAKDFDEEFLTVVEEIEKTIKEQQLDGAAVGTFNQSIVAHLLGMVNKTENTNINYDAEVSKEEAKKIAKDLEDGC